MSAPDSGPLAGTTAADVLRWGRAQPADTVVGVCKSRGYCLIAQYAMQVLRVAVEVSPTPDMAGEYRLQDTTYLFDLSQSLNRLALAFDDLMPDGTPYRSLEMYPADLDRLTMEATP